MPDLDLIFAALAENPRLHAPNTSVYKLLKGCARAEIEKIYRDADSTPRPFGPFGPVSMPYTRMGAIDSLDLFGLDELIIFAFYQANRGRYRKVLDIGANIGLHSVILGKCGFAVRSYEPDPRHFALLKANLDANQVSSVEPFPAAISVRDGKADFVRVLGNTTGSHLAGAKDSYGEREYFPVDVKAVSPLFAWADLAKIDAEGHERDILLSATREDIAHLDIIVEIGSPANAAAVFAHFQKLGVGLFPQKIGWRMARSQDDIPVSHRDGSLFISAKAEMPW